MKKKTYIIIPAFNEERTIGKVVKDVEAYVDKIIIVNDGSTDKTVEKIKSKKAVVLSHPVNMGPGAARETGFEYARREDPDIVITYDADDQFMASDIPRVVEPVLKGEADVTFGSRFLGKVDNIPFLRLITLKLAILFTYLFSGVKLTDAHIGIRALNNKALNKIVLTQNGTAYASEFIDQIQKHKLRLVEVPVTVKYSKYSKSKGQKDIAALKIFFDLIFDKLK